MPNNQNKNQGSRQRDEAELRRRQGSQQNQSSERDSSRGRQDAPSDRSIRE